MGSLQEGQMAEINLGLFRKDERAVGHRVHSSLQLRPVPFCAWRLSDPGKAYD